MLVDTSPIVGRTRATLAVESMITLVDIGGEHSWELSLAEIKIVSDPYRGTVTFETLERAGWVNIGSDNHPNSRLRANNLEQSFFAFKVKAIIDIIIDEFGGSDDRPRIVFEGTDDAYEEIEALCESEYRERVTLERGSRYLSNASDAIGAVLNELKALETPQPMDVRNDDRREEPPGPIASGNAVSFCLFGHRRKEKSAFANALVGHLLLCEGNGAVERHFIRFRNVRKPNAGFLRIEAGSQALQIELNGTDMSLNEIGQTENPLSPLKSEIEERYSADEQQGFISSVRWLLSHLGDIDDGSSGTPVFRLPEGSVITVGVPFRDSEAWDGSAGAEVVYVPDSYGTSGTQAIEQSFGSPSVRGQMLPLVLCDMDDLLSDRCMELCETLLAETDLDTRFSMIIVNISSTDELPKAFSSSFEARILSRPFPKLLNGQGVFFVSLEDALAASGPDTAEPEVEKGSRFGAEPSAGRCERRLYRFNIQPDQIKSRSEEAMRRIGDVTSVDCGLYAVEREMGAFAERYAPYQFCQRANRQIAAAVRDDAKRIVPILESLRNDQDRIRLAMFQKKEDLLKSLHATEKTCWKNTKGHYGERLRESIDWGVWENAIEDFVKAEEAILADVARRNDLDLTKQSVQEKIHSVGPRFLQRVKDAANVGDINHVAKALPKFFNDISSAAYELDKMKRLQDDAESEVASLLYDQIVAEYLAKSERANDFVREVSAEYLKSMANSAIRQLSLVASGVDGASDDSLAELPALEFEDLPFAADAGDLKFKERFVQGIHLGNINMLTSYNLDLKALDETFDKQMHEVIEESMRKAKDSHLKTFSHWLLEVEECFAERIDAINVDLIAGRETIEKNEREMVRLTDEHRDLESARDAIAGILDWKA